MSGPTDLAHDDHVIEQAILALLLQPALGPSVWALEDLAREIGDATRTTDAVRRLQAAGLLHHSGELVLVSRAAVRSAALLTN